MKISDLLKKIIRKIAFMHFFDYMSDELYLKLIYWTNFNTPLEFNNPQTFNQKIQWLKINDRKPIYTTLVDKYEVKKYISDKIGEKYIIPTLGIWKHFDDIDFNQLPDQFVLKCTHDSGGLVICQDKNKLDYKKAKEKIEKSLKQNYYLHGREWPYKDVEPRIIAEKYMVDESGTELKDYKFFCFNGKAKIMFIASDRNSKNTETKFDFYDMDFNHLPFTNGHPNSDKKINKPKSFDRMKELAEQLSKDIPLLRVDFYDINGDIYFGELTFYHWSGFTPFDPEIWDKKLGDLIELPKNK